ncbi:hypothetical protein BB558_000926 [Smittium angustum]|uniref:Cell division control protein 24 OB domain-containing protein n=1 Tax=Smittium angustum TaxID=133377 RepID=A0A2U1JCU8_SMIAN|nr:hypothetical protein BB558_000926 [Smittium angustum]
MYSGHEYWDMINNPVFGWFFTEKRKIRILDVEVTKMKSITQNKDPFESSKFILPGAKIVFIINGYNSLDVGNEIENVAPNKKLRTNDSSIHIYTHIGNNNVNREISTETIKNEEKDSSFILDMFGVIWDSGLKRYINIGEKDKPVCRANQFWFYISTIETTEAEVIAEDWLKSGLVSVYSFHGNIQTGLSGEVDKAPRKQRVVYGEMINEFGEIFEIQLTLWDSSTRVADLFNEGEYMGIWNAIVADEFSGSFEKKRILRLGLGPQSILFADGRPELSLKNDMSRSTSADSNENGNVILTNDERFYIKDLTEDLDGILIVGNVLLVSNNLPYLDNGIETLRRVVRLEDSSGVCDITFWGPLSIDAAKLLEGQTVVTGGLTTIKGPKTCYINATESNGSFIFPVNTFPGLLSSPGLRKCTYICNAFNQTLSYIGAFVRDVKPKGLLATKHTYKTSEFIVITHNICLSPVIHDTSFGEFTVYNCEKCKMEDLPLSDLIKVFHFDLYIDDGSTCEWMECTASAANVILGTTPKTLEESKNNAVVADVIGSLIGKEYLFCISYLKPKSSKQKSLNSGKVINNSTTKFRIDSALLLQNISSYYKKIEKYLQ